MPYVTTEIADAVATLTLDHERRRNALGRALVEEVIAALAIFREAKARAVILRARPGARVFSAGHDVDELPAGGRDPLGWDDPLRRLVRAIEAYPGPVIAMVEGSVWGGATETVMACDLVVAAEGATFAVTPARLGVPYNVGGMLTFLNAAPLRLVKEMVFTAEPVDAARAERHGMVNHVVPAAELEGFTRRLARAIAGNAPLSVAGVEGERGILAGGEPESADG